jgi:hypothetical protein
VTKLLHDVTERFLVSFDTVWPPASGLVEVSSAPIVGMHPHDRLVETQRLQSLQGAPHQCLPDASAPALRRDEEPINLPNRVVFVRPEMRKADNPVVSLRDEGKSFAPKRDARRWIERGHCVGRPELCEANLRAADLDDRDGFGVFRNGSA